MKKYILIFLLLPFTILHSQNDWVFQNPYPVGCYQSFMKYLKYQGNECFLSIGGGGSVLKTFNNGNTWDTKFIDGYPALTSAYFVDSLYGWACSLNGEIFRTTNGGNNWIKSSTNTNYELNDIQFINRSTGYCVGQVGVVFKSTDGGANWTFAQTPVGTTFNSMCFVNTNTGWASSLYGPSIKTTNGGILWSQMTYDARCMRFFNQNTGIYIISNNVRRTVNSGNNWINQATFYGLGNLLTIDYKNNGYCWLTEDQGRLIKSTDYGANWSVISNSIYGGMTSLSFKDTMTAMAVGANIFNSTTDGGLNWTMKTQGIITGQMNYIHFSNLQTGYFSSYDGTIAYTNNGGSNWQKINHGLSTFFNAIESREFNAWMVGDKGYIIKTTNSGNNWTTFKHSNNYNFQSVSFANNETGWAAGYSNGIVKTSNGGLNWFDLTTGLYATYNFIYFINDNTGWVTGYISGYVPKVCKTTNGGISWDTLTLSQNIRPKRMFFVDENIGWIGAEYGSVLFKTTNGGTNWEAYNHAGFNFGYKIQFLNQNTGYSSGRDLSFAKTTNGGLTWLNIIYPDNIDVRSFHFINENTGWIASNTSVLKTTTGGTIPIRETNIIIPEYITVQNYPNPFNGNTVIRFSISKKEKILLKIFDITGKEIINLVNEVLLPGNYEKIFTPGNLSTGIYFYSLVTPGKMVTGKMVYLK